MISDDPKSTGILSVAGLSMGLSGFGASKKNISKGI